MKRIRLTLMAFAMILFALGAQAQNPNDSFRSPSKHHFSHRPINHDHHDHHDDFPNTHFQGNDIPDGVAEEIPFYVASREQIDDIVACLKDIPFDDKKLSVAKLCVTLCPIDVRGLGQIAKVFAFDDARLEFLKFAYYFCPDPQNYLDLCDVMTFSTNADKLFRQLHIRRN